MPIEADVQARGAARVLAMSCLDEVACTSELLTGQEVGLGGMNDDIYSLSLRPSMADCDPVR
jgi:hypothetical protein